MTENPNMPPLVGEDEYNDPTDMPPPRGCKLILHTEGGTCVIGQWSDDGGFDGWKPLPKFRRKEK